MSLLQLILPKKLSEKVIHDAFILIEQAVNKLTAANFPNALDGDTLIAANSLSLGRLEWQRMDIPLILLSAAVSTTSTTGAAEGGLWRYNPLNFTNGETATFPAGAFYLAGTIATQNASATAALEVYNGAALLGSISTVSTSGVWVESTALTMPSAEADLSLKLKTSNASYAAYLWNCYLLYKF
ncbi:MAG: hypothetical protein ACYDG6_11275 [Thermincolia bacterium]